ncbi:MAG: hypothetical protein GTO17_09600 [Candidatus Aminicenantes bacterium]|nr:hypothetical protein [Candidatus Aminicenantes bacterium]
MDRRGFCKTFLFMPLFASSFDLLKKIRGHVELQILASSPDKYIVPLLGEIQKYGLLQGQNFSALSFQPQKAALIEALSQHRWVQVQNPSLADFVISFFRLSKPVPGSFSLVRNKTVWDIRFKKLLSIWEELNRTHASLLTVVSSSQRGLKLQRGSKASVYIEGRKVERLSLRNNYSKSFVSASGRVKVLVEDGRVRVIDSTCPQKICLHSAPIALEGERIICAPNHFLLEIEAQNSVDTVIG